MPTHPPPPRFTNYTNLPFEVLMATFTVLPVLALICLYPALPERVPEYLNLHGDVEVWGRKGLASVFRLPLMAVDLQMLCLLMKYGLWQGKITHSFEDGGKYAIHMEESLTLYMRLWDWLRALIAAKLGASSLDPIFFGIERLRFLSTAVRVISWAAAILGIVGAVFYGYRLVMVNRRLKEVGGKNTITEPTDKSHLHGGILYYNPDDPLLFKDKYVFNFANKWVYVFIACLLSLPLLMFLPMLNP